MKVRWSETAASQVEAIYDFIAADNSSAAMATIDQLFGLTDRLAEFPHLGRRADAGRRQLIRPPFIFVYRVMEDVVNIEAIFHGSRKY